MYDIQQLISPFLNTISAKVQFSATGTADNFPVIYTQRSHNFCLVDLRNAQVL